MSHMQALLFSKRELLTTNFPGKERLHFGTCLLFIYLFVCVCVRACVRACMRAYEKISSFIAHPLPPPPPCSEIELYQLLY